MPNRQLPRLLSRQMSKSLPFLADFACDRLCIVCIRDSALEQLSAPVGGKICSETGGVDWTGLPGAFYLPIRSG
jgi:hypothetical protein